jgi:hypothetical protein
MKEFIILGLVFISNYSNCTVRSEYPNYREVNISIVTTEPAIEGSISNNRQKPAIRTLLNRIYCGIRNKYKKSSSSRQSVTFNPEVETNTFEVDQSIRMRPYIKGEMDETWQVVGPMVTFNNNPDISTFYVDGNMKKYFSNKKEKRTRMRDTAEFTRIAAGAEEIQKKYNTKSSFCGCISLPSSR